MPRLCLCRFLFSQKHSRTLFPIPYPLHADLHYLQHSSPLFAQECSLERRRRRRGRGRSVGTERRANLGRVKRGEEGGAALLNCALSPCNKRTNDSLHLFKQELRVVVGTWHIRIMAAKEGKKAQSRVGRSLGRFGD